MPGPVSGRGGRRAEQTVGEILPTHVYCNEEEIWCGLLPGSVFFRLMTSSLQLGVVGVYPVQGVRFSSRLLLKRTGHI
jgi:hypothetical protein